jgi:single-stranded-DNA-specific exonuclease
VAHEVAAEPAPGLVDAPVSRQLDEVGRLVVVQIVVLDEAELDRRGCHPLLEVIRVEGKSVTKELDDVVLARAVVRRGGHETKNRQTLSDRVRTVASRMEQGTWTISPCPHRESSALAEALEVSETTARVLVRRGYGDPEQARAFLAGEPPGHDPFLLGDMAGACEAIRRAIADGKRICVHGDYDADGICATALALLVLRELGADAAWHLPSRFEEGYGLRAETLTRLADEGCGLVLTVDCGITAAEEVVQARALGVEVVVTDHHRPGEALPDCPVVATRPSDYPFPELCGTGVVYKLGEALLGGDSETLRRHLDLVALATISDVVPLVDENRALALAGLRALARTQKPGLRALMRAARVDPATVDEGAVGFRLAPRINAAGRLSRPGAALDLLLTDDADEAGRLAHQLEELNRERQGIEDRILREAMAQVEEWPEAKQRRRGYVLADEGWHEGVIGIVASRLVERFHRPVVLVAGTDGDWKGSGRSTPAFDLHGALSACSSHLERFGGHRAAAGLSVQPEHIEAFAEAFAAHADGVLAEEDLRPVTRVDAVVAGRELTLDLCAELRRLAPFGLGNPGVTLLLPACELRDLGAVGEGRHLRFRVNERGRDAGSAIAFGIGAQLDRFRAQGRYDVVFRLEENHWNGTVAPQLVVRRIFESADRYEELRGWLAAQWRLADAERSAEAQTVFAELELNGDAGARRQLLESETFRSLLEEPLERAA